jgi:hypothetical protein
MEPKDLVGKVVYDVERNLCGRVKAFYAPGEYVSSHNGAPVDAPVLEFEGGESFVAKPEALKRWTVIEDSRHDAFQRDVVAAVGQIIKALCQAAHGFDMPPKLAFLMVGRAFQTQGGVLLKSEDGEQETWDGR